MSNETCAHIETITTVKHPNRRECEECVKIGTQWVHLTDLSNVWSNNVL